MDSNNKDFADLIFRIRGITIAVTEFADNIQIQIRNRLGDNLSTFHAFFNDGDQPPKAKP